MARSCSAVPGRPRWHPEPSPTLVPRQGRLVRKSADPGFRWVRRRTGLVPGVLGRFAGAASGKLGRRVTWQTFLAGALGTGARSRQRAAVDPSNRMFDGLVSKATEPSVPSEQVV